MHNHRLQGAINHKVGEIAQGVVRNRLVAMGVAFVQPIHAGWRIARKGARIIGASPLEKVAGDFWGILPDGRALLCEVKARQDVLAYDDLEPHQHRALASIRAAGGVPVVAWAVSGVAVWFLDYPIAGWVKGKPLHHATAAELDRVCFLHSLRASGSMPKATPTAS